MNKVSQARGYPSLAEPALASSPRFILTAVEAAMVRLGSLSK
jgi:hypothetical protein